MKLEFTSWNMAQWSHRKYSEEALKYFMTELKGNVQSPNRQRLCVHRLKSQPETGH
jgi:hypothetical protein